ncbi:DEAD/DEAH box helicase [Brachybacterium timonense]|uniref:DEAD/DEAH box helicase n=1 Tax=Brachybacterium timonense TaxID=2050896 RepID=UPI000D0B607C|nr:DEAD/DEAH box helicase [Brachybacterium timonense]
MQSHRARSLLEGLTLPVDRTGCLTHVEQMPARPGRTAPFPAWLDPRLRDQLEASGITAPWTHQVAAADLLHGGQDVVLSTGTASGKSLAYLMPTLTAVGARELDSSSRRATALYLAPTKALAADQLTTITAMAHGACIRDARVAVYDGDTPTEERRWVRRHGSIVLTNPDMLHFGILPGHEQWASFFRALHFVIVDECHTYRGVFGSHVAMVLRRLRRIAEHYHAEPAFLLASATTANPELSASRLIGRPVTAVTEDGSPRAGLTVGLWEPGTRERDGGRAEPSSAAGSRASSAADGQDVAGEPVRTGQPGAGERVPAGQSGAGERVLRRSATTESAALLADLVAQDVRTLVFARSRRGAELVASAARRRLNELARARSSAGLAERAQAVAAYRGGYLAAERRALEAALRSGDLLALASTNALELGIDIAGLDAVLVAGWPGTRASLWQQFGRAGRRHDGNGGALAVFIAREDPLDTYVVHHPESVFGAPVEAAVFDPANPYVMTPHLCAAASELPIRSGQEEIFGPTSRELLDTLVARGVLRARPTGWYWTMLDSAHELTDLRGSGGEPVRIVERGDGTLLGTVDAASAHTQVHTGAVHVHQGRSYVVDELDVERAVAFVHREDPLHTTHPQSTSSIRIRQVDEHTAWADGVELCFGTVDVSEQVTGYQVRDVYTQAVLANHPLDLPVRTLTTKAVWWVIPRDLTERAGLPGGELPGALHAAEHAAISLLPLLATCDRWDIGGVSTALHEDTGEATIFVYDGAPGGAGFARRGVDDAGAWLRATADMIQACPCADGCPACIVSPKCGNGNEPLSKAEAQRLLGLMQP